jgi:hypothetical protein
MTTEITTAETTWDAAQKLLVTRLQGDITVEVVRRWQASLQSVLNQIEANSQFKMIVDLYGYELKDIAAHKEMRTVIPLTLANYGFRTALLDLFEPLELPLQQTRGIICQAVAHIHHDAYKMAEYERRLGWENERFFTEYEQAAVWIQKIAASSPVLP